METNKKVPFDEKLRDRLTYDILKYTIKKGPTSIWSIVKWIEESFNIEFWELPDGYGYSIWEYYVMPIANELRRIGLCE